jgi:galactose mutarotase-like enzyme
MILENEHLRVRIGAGRGARVEEFIDKKRKKDWVWRTAEASNADAVLDLSASFDEHWAGGWEEVFPNDAPVELQGLNLVDHGEVWRRNWQQEPQTDKNSASFFISLSTYPALLRKKFLLDETEAKFTIDYEIESRADKALPFIFKFHPAIRIEAKDKFRFPDSIMVPVAPGFGNILHQKDQVPYQGDLIDEALELDGKKREFTRLSKLADPVCSVWNERTQSGLMLEFASQELSYLWVFQSYGGFRNHYVCMLEPTNANHYDLSKVESELKSGEVKKITLTFRIIDA